MATNTSVKVICQAGHYFKWRIFSPGHWVAWSASKQLSIELCHASRYTSHSAHNVCKYWASGYLTIRNRPWKRYMNVIVAYWFAQDGLSFLRNIYCLHVVVLADLNRSICSYFGGKWWSVKMEMSILISFWFDAFRWDDGRRWRCGPSKFWITFCIYFVTINSDGVRAW
jgi:hypothetical protein